MYMWNFSVALELFCFASHSLQLRCCFCCPAVCLMPRSDASKTALLEWYFKTITIQQPPSYQNSTGLQTISKLSSKLLHSRTSHLLLVSPLISLRYLHLIRLSSPSAQLIKICYLCHTAIPVFGQRSFSYCSPKTWNDIPLSVRQSPSLDSFKRNVKNSLFCQ